MINEVAKSELNYASFSIISYLINKKRWVESDNAKIVE